MLEFLQKDLQKIYACPFFISKITTVVNEFNTKLIYYRCRGFSMLTRLDCYKN